ncbi:ATP-binding protein [Streptomyces sp. NPDC039028]|uniref:ATP-binding protein n=1 Tax=unclassified Streptomyces TaxID=2593676 RepID=UPI0033FA7AD2
MPLPMGDGRLAGREAERARLVRVLDALGHGRGVVVEIVGEPGSGKTQLACVMAEEAARRGLPVLWARGHRPGDEPFDAFRDLVGASGAPEAPTPAVWCERVRQRAAGGVLVLDELHRADPSTWEVVLRLIRASTSDASFRAGSVS